MVDIFIAFAISLKMACNDNRELKTCKISQDSISKTKFYKTVDEPAKYPGGEPVLSKFIQENFHFKEKDNIYKIIYVGFIVKSTGNLISPRIVGKKQNNLSQAEKRLLKMIKKMPKWDPAVCGGKVVPYLVVIPIRF